MEFKWDMNCTQGFYLSIYDTFDAGDLLNVP